MDYLIKTLTVTHIVAGFISLLLFWAPLFTKKGGVNHQRVGKRYVQLMWIVVSTAVLLSIKNFSIGNSIMGAFLGFLSLVTAKPLWYGIAILKQKKGVTKQFQRIQLVFSSCIVATSITLIGYGIALGGVGAALLMFIFGGLGLTEIPDFIQGIKRNAPPAARLKNHIISMCTSGIAAYTAFLVFGANQVFNYALPGYWAIVPWVAPAIFGTVGIRYAVHRFAMN
jgi:hypothetical protein